MGPQRTLNERGDRWSRYLIALSSMEAIPLSLRRMSVAERTAVIPGTTIYRPEPSEGEPLPEREVSSQETSAEQRPSARIVNLSSSDHATPLTCFGKYTWLRTRSTCFRRVDPQMNASGHAKDNFMKEPKTRNRGFLYRRWSGSRKRHASPSGERIAHGPPIGTGHIHVKHHVHEPP